MANKIIRDSDGKMIGRIEDDTSSSRSSADPADRALDNQLFKWGAISGSLTGVVVGFQQAGIGGAIVGAAAGAIGGPMVALLIVRVILPFLVLAGIVGLLGGIVMGVTKIISLLWGVGKP